MSEKSEKKAADEEVRSTKDAGLELLKKKVEGRAPELFQYVTDLATGFTPTGSHVSDMAQWAAWVSEMHQRAHAMMMKILRTLPQQALLALDDEQWVQECRGLAPLPPQRREDLPASRQQPPADFDAKQNLLSRAPKELPLALRE